MLIGVPKEIKDHEYRVGLIPAGVEQLTRAGHTVSVQAAAGARVGFADDAYKAAGAHIVSSAADAYRADLVIKVKELQHGEFGLTHPGQILFCYHHFAPDPGLLDAVLNAKVACVAYETVTAPDGSLPLLVPMSQIAGRLAPQVGAWSLEMANGGRGILLGGVPGVAPAKVVIIGGGTVGESAARIALGMGAEVTIATRSAARLGRLEEIYGASLKTAISNPQTLAGLVASADLVIGAVLAPGQLAPKLVRRDDLKRMRSGSVIVDVAIDQGGICETSRPTSHTRPLYIEENIVHYCVPNMPSAVARTATLALTQATLPYAIEIANKGLRRAVSENRALKEGLQTLGGHVTHSGLARDAKRPFTDPLDANKPGDS
jgi:alanine dehydrogenase